MMRLQKKPTTIVCLSTGDNCSFQGTRSCRRPPSSAHQAHQAASFQTPRSPAPRPHWRQCNAGIHLDLAEPSSSSLCTLVRRGLGTIPEHTAIGQQHLGRNVLLKHPVQTRQQLLQWGERESGRRFGHKSCVWSGELLAQ